MIKLPFGMRPMMTGSSQLTSFTEATYLVEASGKLLQNNHISSPIKSFHGDSFYSLQVSEDVQQR